MFNSQLDTAEESTHELEDMKVGNIQNHVRSQILPCLQVSLPQFYGCCETPGSEVKDSLFCQSINILVSSSIPIPIGLSKKSQMTSAHAAGCVTREEHGARKLESFIMDSNMPILCSGRRHYLHLPKLFAIHISWKK